MFESEGGRHFFSWFGFMASETFVITLEPAVPLGFEGVTLVGGEGEARGEPTTDIMF